MKKKEWLNGALVGAANDVLQERLRRHAVGDVERARDRAVRRQGRLLADQGTGAAGLHVGHHLVAGQEVCAVERTAVCLLPGGPAVLP